MELHEAVDSLRWYANHGRPTGGFLRAVLANDLMQVINRGDESSLEQLPAICRFIYNQLPANTHGSYEAVDAHIAACAERRAEQKGVGA